jgi:hypothetical protein
MEIAVSINKVPVRLTKERWHHISTGHPEIADYYFEILETIENPKTLYEGMYGELIAISNKLEQSNKFIVAVYKEIDSNDGFIITAYLTNKEQKFEKKKVLWKQ